jgi:tRNA A-37 threonylcarbamoyl transferase component Bud32
MYDRRALEPIIEQMHSAGVWHNDLYARNVLRNRKGELRLVDFGAASFHDRGKDRWQPDDFDFTE